MIHFRYRPLLLQDLRVVATPAACFVYLAETVPRRILGVFCINPMAVLALHFLELTDLGRLNKAEAIA